MTRTNGGLDIEGRIDAASDGELLRLVATGDEAALAVFIDRHRGRVQAVLHGGLRQREDVEEATQDVFLRVGRAAERFDPRLPLGPWLATIARNVLRDRLRARKPRLLPLPEDPHEGLGLYQESVRVEEVRAALDDLDEHDRAPLVLRYFAELSYRDAGRELHVSARGFESRLARAKVRLRRAILRRRATDGM